MILMSGIKLKYKLLFECLSTMRLAVIQNVVKNISFYGMHCNTALLTLLSFIFFTLPHLCILCTLYIVNKTCTFIRWTKNEIVFELSLNIEFLV